MRYQKWLITMLLITLAATVITGCGKTEKEIYSGTVETTQYNLQSQITGQVLEVKAAEGQRIKAGDLVAVLDIGENQYRVDQAVAALENAKAVLAKLQKGARQEQVAQARDTAVQLKATVDGAAKSLAYREQNLTRLQQLFADGAATRQQVDDADNQVVLACTKLQEAQAQYRAAQDQLRLLQNGETVETIAAAKANVAQAEAALAAAQSQAKKAEIYAVTGGTVIHRVLESGEMAMPGSTVITVADLSNLWVKVYLPERQLAKIKLAQSVKVTSDAYPNRTFQGKVIWIADEAEFTPKNVATKEAKEDVVFAVKVKIDAAQQLKPGMTVDVEF